MESPESTRFIMHHPTHWLKHHLEVTTWRPFDLNVWMLRDNSQQALDEWDCCPPPLSSQGISHTSSLDMWGHKGESNGTGGDGSTKYTENEKTFSWRMKTAWAHLSSPPFPPSTPIGITEEVDGEGGVHRGDQYSGQSSDAERRGEKKKRKKKNLSFLNLICSN